MNTKKGIQKQHQKRKSKARKKNQQFKSIRKIQINVKKRNS